MKIIEAMKEQKLILQKLASNRENIQKYASILSNERPLLEDEKTQKAEVAALIQSSEDLVKRLVWLKTRVDYTNLKTNVSIMDKTYTIAELLVLHRKGNELRGLTFAALNTNPAQQKRLKLTTMASAQPADPVNVVAMYDEKKVDQAKRDLMDFHGTISGTLEVINATTDLIEEIL